MSSTGRLIDAVVRAVASIVRSPRNSTATRPVRPTRRSSDAPAGAPRSGEVSPGREGASATVEIDPRGIRSVRFAYAPERDGEPDPGEVVWTWVPYEEADGRGKDRPVAIVAAGGPDEFLAVQLTSKSHDGERDHLALGTGGWDASGRPSWARTDRVFLVHADGMRREGATLDRTRFESLTRALANRYGWKQA